MNKTLRCPSCKGDMERSKPDQNGIVIWSCPFCRATFRDKIGSLGERFKPPISKIGGS